MGMGYRKVIWSKELDDNLLKLITNGKKLTQLESIMKLSRTSIKKRLHEMGFENFVDAKVVLTNN